MTIPEIADALEGSPRDADKEKPDSDAVAKTLAQDLRLASANRPDAETFGVRK